MSNRKLKLSRWYFGGLASGGAACVTHPLDLIKVHLQTQQEGKASIFRIVKNIVQSDGIFGLYNGLSASLARQLTYSTARFGIYEVIKQALSTPGQPLSFPIMVAMASISGAVGGFVGVPADLVNVRMQNDVKLSPEKRRNYKHAIDGIYRVLKEEGVKRMFGGGGFATCRAVLMTVGQLSFYDQIKVFLLRTDFFEDNFTTHFTASLSAGAVATTLTQPLDVLKTRAMNAKPGEFKNLMEVVTYTAKLGPLGFFKGTVSCIRTAISRLQSK